jgi:hypothetical protein
VDDATDLRCARAGAQYEAEQLRAAEVDDALRTLTTLLAALPPLMGARLETAARAG